MEAGLFHVRNSASHLSIYLRLTSNPFWGRGELKVHIFLKLSLIYQKKTKRRKKHQKKSSITGIIFKHFFWHEAKTLVRIRWKVSQHLKTDRKPEIFWSTYNQLIIKIIWPKKWKLAVPISQLINFELEVVWLMFLSLLIGCLYHTVGII